MRARAATHLRPAHARFARRRGRPPWRPRTSSRAQTVVRLERQGAVRSARRAAVLEGGAITAVIEGWHNATREKRRLSVFFEDFGLTAMRWLESSQLELPLASCWRANHLPGGGGGRLSEMAVRGFDGHSLPVCAISLCY